MLQSWPTRRGLLRATPVLAAARVARAAGIAVAAEVVRWKLRHTWTTVMSSSEYRDNLYVRLTADGVTGVGEGAPIVRYKETAAGGRRVVESLAPMLASADAWQFSKILADVFRRVPGEWAAKAAMDIALVVFVL
jgi:L-alanine-DL-glutamate epimerase-like enolase superfamily enzyme